MLLKNFDFNSFVDIYILLHQQTMLPFHLLKLTSNIFKLKNRVKRFNEYLLRL